MFYLSHLDSLIFLQVFISVYMLQRGDQCLNATRLEYRSGENGPTSKLFTKAQAVVSVGADTEYNLTVYQSYADGHESIVWTDSYKTIAGM